MPASMDLRCLSKHYHRRFRFLALCSECRIVWSIASRPLSARLMLKKRGVFQLLRQVVIKPNVLRDEYRLSRRNFRYLVFPNSSVDQVSKNYS